MSDYQGVCIFGEWTGEDIHEVTYELLSEGRRLADQLEVPLQVLFLGPPEAEKGVRDLVHYGADRSLPCLIPDWPGFETTFIAVWWSKFFKKNGLKSSFFLLLLWDRPWPRV